MSLYVFNIFSNSAVVSADTRMCTEKDGITYQVNDNAQKLFVVDDLVFTLGGVCWVCEHILKQFTSSALHTMKNMHEIVLNIVANIDKVAATYGPVATKTKYKNNPYLLEICAVRYEKAFGHNVFYQIATSNEYQLLSINIDGVFRPTIRAIGGADTEIIEGHFAAHENAVRTDYLNTLLRGYELSASEKIGGNLMVAIQNNGVVDVRQRPIENAKKIRRYHESCGTTYNTISKNLLIQCPDVNGGVMKYKVDQSGVFMHNGRYYMDSQSGRIGMDSNWGIFGGPNALFDVTGTGYVKPSFVGDNGVILLDEDGFPKDTDFLLGMNRKHFFRGTIHATGGKFTGDLYANNLYFNDGGDVKTLLSQATKKISSGLLDLGNIQLDGDSGDINMTGSINMDGNIKLKGNITWDQSSFPLKSQFSTSITGPWHNTMQTNDKYRRDIAYDGTWGVPYQFVGVDGQRGSDADVPAWVKAMKSTYIDSQWVISPNIVGGKITALDKMEAACDFYVGNMIRLGKFRSGSNSIYFNDTANITSYTQDSLSISCENLNLETISHINWGNNAPVSKFG